MEGVELVIFAKKYFPCLFFSALQNSCFLEVKKKFRAG